MIKLNKTVNPFSEQMFINCLTEDKPVRANKCQGGTEAEVFQHAITNGVVYESSESSLYIAEVERCIKIPKDYEIIGFGRVNTSSPDALKAAIRRSPVTAVIDSEVIHFLARVSVPSDFIVDSKTIGCNPLGSNTGVAVLLVGYDKETFIVKGSWGKDMGQQGFFRIKIDQTNGSTTQGSCGVMGRNFFPIVRETSPPK